MDYMALKVLSVYKYIRSRWIERLHFALYTVILQLGCIPVIIDGHLFIFSSDVLWQFFPHQCYLGLVTAFSLDVMTLHFVIFLLFLQRQIVSE